MEKSFNCLKFAKVTYGNEKPLIESIRKKNVFRNSVWFLFKNRCSKHSDSFVQIPFIGEMVPNLVILNYPDLSKEMKSGDKKPLFGKSYLIRNHFWVNFGPKRTKIDTFFVHFGSYWMLISMVKKLFGHFLHRFGHRNRMIAQSCPKMSFLGSENQSFNIFEFFCRLQFFFNFFAELQIW